MSGLLDKAKETVKASQDEIKVESHVVEIDSEGILMDHSSSNDSGLNTTQLQFQLGAVSLFLVTMVTVLFMDTITLFGGFTIDDLFVPGILLSWAIFNAQDLMAKVYDTQKLVVSGVVFILVTALFAGVAIFNSSDSGVTIANIEFDGDNNEIDLSFYGPSGMDYTIDVLVDGKVEYSHDATINIDKGSHSVDLDDFWKGNAEDMNGKELVEYEITVTSEGGEESMKFDDIMNREIDTAFIKVVEKYSYDSSGENKIYEGIYVEMIVGMGTPSADFDFADGIFTGDEPLPIESDWDATIRVLGGDAIPQYDISADEGVANGYGDFNFDWVSLHMDGGYLDKGDFYGDDGCYTFEITIENVHGDTFTSTDSQIEFFWDSNEAGGDDPATAC